MNYKHQLLAILCMVATVSNGIAQDSKQEVLKVVNTFFRTMENKDATAFNDLFLENAYAYSIRQQGDSTLVRNSILKASTTTNSLKERLRDEEITIHIHNNVAAVWAAYDFWINDKHSHCGYEIFTLIKTNNAWKIASLTYSVEQDACNE
ncbi:MAG: nuclear transport factor 2 family protein [Maribacter sp.]|uniref:nuclear transport factor 2 family protein n=1 Tax=Maribacter sp. TaxID=1897614 RepID=UPI00329A2C22